MATAIVALLATAQHAWADNILRRAGNTPASSPSASSAQAAAQAATAAAKAAAFVRQADSPLRKALESIRTFQGDQAAARAAALAASGDVPNGLQAGGLAVAPSTKPDPECDPSSAWCGASLPTEAQKDGRTTVTVVQGEKKALLTWESFNVGRETDLRFDQSAGGNLASTWLVLNRVTDPSGRPSEILGSIRADGHVFVLNRNGILFRGSSQLNLATLVASGMDFAGATLLERNALFLDPETGGIARSANPAAPAPIFEGEGGGVTIEAGARIEVAPYGQALVIGGTTAGATTAGVLNRGSIEAPDGQVLLAAGSRVSLAKALDQRGYATPLVAGEGRVTNAGIVSTPRGNITLAASEVEQAGILTATTSGKANGSIRVGQELSPVTRVTFGEGSVTQILPDETGEKLVGKTTLDARSTLEVHGERIEILGGATVYVPSGNVTLSASMNGRLPGTPDDTRIYVAPEARIDVSGLDGVEVPVEQNSIRGELRASELRDNPVLRNGPLRGRTVYFDGRQGVEVANLAGYGSLVERGVKELMTDGGSLTLAANEVITRAGSVIDISGGSLRYLDGMVRTSFLIDEAGKQVRIEDAVVGTPYVGIVGDFVVPHQRWNVSETYVGAMRARPRFEPGYEQGGRGGTLRVKTNYPSWLIESSLSPEPQENPVATGAYRILDGDVLASTVVGPRQVAQPRRGAGLVLEQSGDVVVGDFGPQLLPGFTPDEALPESGRYVHALPTRWFDGKTFTSISIQSGYWPDASSSGPGSRNSAPGGHLIVRPEAVVDLGAGGSFTFIGKGARIDGALRAPGGSVSLQALQLGETPWAQLAPAERPTLHLGATGVIDVAGRWSNRQIDSAVIPPGALDGGSVTLTGTNVLLDPGSVIDASGGARLDTTGARLTPGKGGSIAIDVRRAHAPRPAAVEDVAYFDGRLVLGGTLRAYGVGGSSIDAAARGGSLALATSHGVRIAAAPPDGEASLFSSAFPEGEFSGTLPTSSFSAGGFSSFTLVGERGVSLVAGTLLAPTVETLLVTTEMRSQPGGRPLDGWATRSVLRSPVRNPVTGQVDMNGPGLPMALTLSSIHTRLPTNGGMPADPGPVVVEDGGSIVLAPGSSVQLLGNASVDGLVEARGGTITVGGEFGLIVGNVAIGPHGRLDVQGYEKITPEGILMRYGVEPGGSVTLSGSTVTVEAGAVIDASGVTGMVSLQPAGGGEGSRYEEVEVAGAAGSIAVKLSARNPSGLLAGTLLLAPGGAGAQGGSLTVDTVGGADLIVGQHPSAPVPQAMVVSAAAVNASGADDVELRAFNPSSSKEDLLLFDGDVSLSSRRSLRLLAPFLGTRPGAPGDVSLQSGYVQLGGMSARDVAGAHASGLSGELLVKAGLIDLSGAVSLGSATVGNELGGFARTRLVSSGDIRLADHDARGILSQAPGLFTDGALELSAAQVYVATRLQWPLELERGEADSGFMLRSGSSISIAGNGNPAPVPLAFGERLTIRAPVIVQGGVVRAPQGQIRLEGRGPDGEPGGSVTLLPGSVTSTSLEGNVAPFGQVLTDGGFKGYDLAGQAPSKSIRIEARDIALQAGATLDVSGGGDLLGYAFVPGNGGSADILAGAGIFAILPSLGAGPAPLAGASTILDPSLKVGDAVWLEGVPGGAPAAYTLLPAHYALLPGGLAVQAVSGKMQGRLTDGVAASARPDGGVIVGGYRASVVADGSRIRDRGYPGWGQFRVMSREVFGSYSELITYSFGTYAQGLAAEAGVAVRTPSDAGRVSLRASGSLVLDGTGRFEPADGGLLGSLDVSAVRIALLGEGGEAPGPGYLSIDSRRLEAIGAGSLLLGGTRAASADGTATDVTVDATDVVVGPGATWAGPELILAARERVTVEGGASLKAQGGIGGDPSPLRLTGDGALLRLSTGERVGVARTGGTTSGGELRVGEATLSGEGSLTMEGSRNVTLATSAAISGKQIELASTRVALGDAPAGTEGTVLGSVILARLGAASDLIIRGQDGIELHGPLVLGSRDAAGVASLARLTFDTGLLQGFGEGVAQITAGEFTIRNGGGGSSGGGAAGELRLDVDLLRLGPGEVQVAGFRALAGRAGAVEAKGTGALRITGGMSLSTGGVVAASGTRYALDVGGDLVLGPDRAAGAPPAKEGLGARIALVAASVSLDTSVVLPAGSFEANARSGPLSLGPNAVVDVSGRQVDFDGLSRFAPGGAIRLFSRGAQGSLTVDAAAVLDASAATGGGDAGIVALTADAGAAVRGILRGGAAAGWRGGDFTLDAAALEGFSALNAGLEQGGFGGSREFRLRGQDLELASGERITAHQVLLRSDTGSVTVAGHIDASGTASHPDGGTIRVVGGRGVVVEGLLDAHAAQAGAGGFDPSRGSVEIVATGGEVDVAPGSVIDLGGGASAAGAALPGGTLAVRAPRGWNGVAGDVAIARLAGEVRGGGDVAVQGVARYDAAVVDAALVGDSTRPGTMLGDAAAWMGNARAIGDRLAAGDADLAARLGVGAGMVVTSGSGLVVQADVPLDGSVGPGYLGLVARDDLEIRSSVSDGFDGASRQTGRLLSSGASASYGLEAGRDVILHPGAMVRTGTGSIAIDAGRDLVLRDPKASGEALPPPVIYTAGHREEPAAGFLGAPTGMPIGDFATGGGDIFLRAGRDVLAPIARQTTSAWLFRYGGTRWGDEATSTPGTTSTSTVTEQTSWSVAHRNFEQGVGALGGGDVEVRAGGDVERLQVAIPTTGHLTTAIDQVPAEGDLVERGGGNLRLVAGGDIQGGLFLLGRGRADLRAGGRAEASGGGPAPLLGLMDATASVVAAGGVEIAAAFDPMRQGQIVENLRNRTVGAAWWGYTERSALSATSLSGDVSYRNDPLASTRLSQALNGAESRYLVTMPGSDFDPLALRVMFGRAPGTLRLTALEGSATVGSLPPAPRGSLVLGPTDRGTLEVVARQDVKLPLVKLLMEDIAPSYRRGPLAAFPTTGGNGLARPGVWAVSGVDVATNSLRGFTPTHLADAEPARLQALEGSVCAYQSGSCVPSLKFQQVADIVVPKPIEVFAGRDIVAGNFQPQNNDPDDLTWIHARRDLFDVAFQVSGEGTAALEAGRDLVQHLSSGKLESIERTQGGLLYGKGDGSRKEAERNPALPRGRGANLLVLAGTEGGMDLPSFAAAYLDPANAQGVVTTYLPALAEYMKGLGYGTMGYAELVAAFSALPRMRRAAFLVDQVYFPELRATGIDYNDPSSERFQSYDRGFRAVSLLFPSDGSAPSGNVILDGKPVETWAQGSIDVVAPHGRVAVGSEVFDTSLGGGIVTRRGGDVRIMADGNIDLFTSRVFTLQGGSITMWTSAGSITAGTGSKTSVFDAPLTYAMSNDGVVTVNTFGLQTGAGIGVLDALQGADPDRPRSRIDLIAPVGEVNAGDAGIRVTGDLNIAALAVVGLENIQVTEGAATGVPQVEAPNLALLATTSQLTAAATQEGIVPSAAAAQKALADLPSIITVEVVGYEKKKSDEESVTP